MYMCMYALALRERGVRGKREEGGGEVGVVRRG
jgi:hypothetical protein